MIRWLIATPERLAIALAVAIVTMSIIEPSLHAFAADCDEWFDERGVPPAPFILAASAAGVVVIVCLAWAGVL